MSQENSNFKILKHPLIEHNMMLLRDKNTKSELFRSALKRIAYFLFAEATKCLRTVSVTTETPLQATKTQVLDSDCEVVIAPILRAGLVFSDVALEFMPSASVQHIGMYRDDDTLKPVWYFDKSPCNYKSPENTLIFVLDPMLATGNSGKETIELFLKKGVPAGNITFMSLIAAPEGVKKIHSAYPDINIITAALDERLNSHGYILPGLGDAGDRIFNSE